MRELQDLRNPTLTAAAQDCCPSAHRRSSCAATGDHDAARGSALAPACSQVSLGTGELSSPRWGGNRGRPGPGRQRSFIAEGGPGSGQRPYFQDNFNRAIGSPLRAANARNDVDVKVVNRQWIEMPENLKRRAVHNKVAVNELIRVFPKWHTAIGRRPPGACV